VSDFAAGDFVRLYNAPEVEGVILAVHPEGEVDVTWWGDGSVEHRADPSALVMVHRIRSRPPTAAPAAYRFRTRRVRRAGPWTYVDASETTPEWLDEIRTATSGDELLFELEALHRGE
jgi:hypothetical protein